jgi:methylated-DNA-protein-cysteine methyltransferase-like protein
MGETGGNWNRVYDVVFDIPSGKVATYGQIAALAGMPGAARQVGWALSALDADDDVPWHRVINAQGEISPRGARETVDLHRALLESEGVELSQRGRVDLGRYVWEPGARKKKRGSRK